MSFPHTNVANKGLALDARSQALEASKEAFSQEVSRSGQTPAAPVLRGVSDLRKQDESPSRQELSELVDEITQSQIHLSCLQDRVLEMLPAEERPAYAQFVEDKVSNFGGSNRSSPAASPKHSPNASSNPSRTNSPKAANAAKSNKKSPSNQKKKTSPKNSKAASPSQNTKRINSPLFTTQKSESGLLQTNMQNQTQSLLGVQFPQQSLWKTGGMGVNMPHNNFHTNLNMKTGYNPIAAATRKANFFHASQMNHHHHAFREGVHVMASGYENQTLTASDDVDEHIGGGNTGNYTGNSSHSSSSNADASTSSYENSESSTSGEYSSSAENSRTENSRTENSYSYDSQTGSQSASQSASQTPHDGVEDSNTMANEGSRYTTHTHNSNTHNAHPTNSVSANQSPHSNHPNTQDLSLPKEVVQDLKPSQEFSSRQKISKNFYGSPELLDARQRFLATRGSLLNVNHAKDVDKFRRSKREVGVMGNVRQKTPGSAGKKVNAVGSAKLKKMGSVERTRNNSGNLSARNLDSAGKMGTVRRSKGKIPEAPNSARQYQPTGKTQVNKHSTLGFKPSPRAWQARRSPSTGVLPCDRQLSPVSRELAQTASAANLNNVISEAINNSTPKGSAALRLTPNPKAGANRHSSTHSNNNGVRGSSYSTKKPPTGRAPPGRSPPSGAAGRSPPSAYNTLNKRNFTAVDRLHSITSVEMSRSPPERDSLRRGSTGKGSVGRGSLGRSSVASCASSRRSSGSLKPPVPKQTSHSRHGSQSRRLAEGMHNNARKAKPQKNDSSMNSTSHSVSVSKKQKLNSFNGLNETPLNYRVAAGQGDDEHSGGDSDWESRDQWVPYVPKIQRGEVMKREGDRNAITNTAITNTATSNILNRSASAAAFTNPMQTPSLQEGFHNNTTSQRAAKNQRTERVRERLDAKTSGGLGSLGSGTSGVNFFQLFTPSEQETARSSQAKPMTSYQFFHKHELTAHDHHMQRTEDFLSRDQRRSSRGVERPQHDHHDTHTGVAADAACHDQRRSSRSLERPQEDAQSMKLRSPLGMTKKNRTSHSTGTTTNGSSNQSNGMYSRIMSNLGFAGTTTTERSDSAERKLNAHSPIMRIAAIAAQAGELSQTKPAEAKPQPKQLVQSNAAKSSTNSNTKTSSNTHNTKSNRLSHDHLGTMQLSHAAMHDFRTKEQHRRTQQMLDIQAESSQTPIEHMSKDSNSNPTIHSSINPDHSYSLSKSLDPDEGVSESPGINPDDATSTSSVKSFGELKAKHLNSRQAQENLENLTSRRHPEFEKTPLIVKSSVMRDGESPGENANSNLGQNDNMNNRAQPPLSASPHSSRGSSQSPRSSRGGRRDTKDGAHGTGSPRSARDGGTGVTNSNANGGNTNANSSANPSANANHANNPQSFQIPQMNVNEIIRPKNAGFNFQAVKAAAGPASFRHLNPSSSQPRGLAGSRPGFLADSQPGSPSTRDASSSGSQQTGTDAQQQPQRQSQIFQQPQVPQHHFQPQQKFQQPGAAAPYNRRFTMSPLSVGNPTNLLRNRSPSPTNMARSPLMANRGGVGRGVGMFQPGSPMANFVSAGSPKLGRRRLGNNLNAANQTNLNGSDAANALQLGKGFGKQRGSGPNRMASAPNGNSNTSNPIAQPQSSQPAVVTPPPRTLDSGSKFANSADSNLSGNPKIVDGDFLDKLASQQKREDEATKFFRGGSDSDSDGGDGGLDKSDDSGPDLDPESRKRKQILREKAKPDSDGNARKLTNDADADIADDDVVPISAISPDVSPSGSPDGKSPPTALPSAVGAPNSPALYEQQGLLAAFPEAAAAIQLRNARNNSRSNSRTRPIVPGQTQPGALLQIDQRLSTIQAPQSSAKTRISLSPTRNTYNGPAIMLTKPTLGQASLATPIMGGSSNFLAVPGQGVIATAHGARPASAAQKSPMRNRVLPGRKSPKRSPMQNQSVRKTPLQMLSSPPTRNLHGSGGLRGSEGSPGQRSSGGRSLIDSVPTLVGTSLGMGNLNSGSPGSKRSSGRRGSAGRGRGQRGSSGRKRLSNSLSPGVVLQIQEISLQTEELLSNEVLNTMSNITRDFNDALSPKFSNSARRSISVEGLRVSPKAVAAGRGSPSNVPISPIPIASMQVAVSPSVTPPLTPATRSPKNVGAKLTSLHPNAVKALAHSRLSSNALPVSPMIQLQGNDKLGDSEATKTPTTLMKIAPWSGKPIAGRASGTESDQLNPTDSEIPKKPKFTPPTDQEFAQPQGRTFTHEDVAAERGENYAGAKPSEEEKYESIDSIDWKYKSLKRVEVDLKKFQRNAFDIQHFLVTGQVSGSENQSDAENGEGGIRGKGSLGDVSHRNTSANISARIRGVLDGVNLKLAQPKIGVPGLLKNIGAAADEKEERLNELQTKSAAELLEGRTRITEKTQRAIEEATRKQHKLLRQRAEIRASQTPEQMKEGFSYLKKLAEVESSPKKEELFSETVDGATVNGTGTVTEAESSRRDDTSARSGKKEKKDDSSARSHQIGSGRKDDTSVQHSNYYATRKAAPKVRSARVTAKLLGPDSKSTIGDASKGSADSKDSVTKKTGFGVSKLALQIRTNRKRSASASAKEGKEVTDKEKKLTEETRKETTARVRKEREMKQVAIKNQGKTLAHTATMPILGRMRSLDRNRHSSGGSSILNRKSESKNGKSDPETQARQGVLFARAQAGEPLSGADRRTILSAAASSAASASGAVGPNSSLLSAYSSRNASKESAFRSRPSKGSNHSNAQQDEASEAVDKYDLRMSNPDMKEIAEVAIPLSDLEQAAGKAGGKVEVVVENEMPYPVKVKIDAEGDADHENDETADFGGKSSVSDAKGESVSPERTPGPAGTPATVIGPEEDDHPGGWKSEVIKSVLPAGAAGAASAVTPATVIGPEERDNQNLNDFGVTVSTPGNTPKGNRKLNPKLMAVTNPNQNLALDSDTVSPRFVSCISSVTPRSPPDSQREVQKMFKPQIGATHTGLLQANQLLKPHFQNLVQAKEDQQQRKLQAQQQKAQTGTGLLQTQLRSTVLRSTAEMQKGGGQSTLTVQNVQNVQNAAEGSILQAAGLTPGSNQGGFSGGAGGGGLFQPNTKFRPRSVFFDGMQDHHTNIFQANANAFAGFAPEHFTVGVDEKVAATLSPKAGAAPPVAVDSNNDTPASSSTHVNGKVVEKGQAENDNGAEKPDNDNVSNNYKNRAPPLAVDTSQVHHGNMSFPVPQDSSSNSPSGIDYGLGIRTPLVRSEAPSPVSSPTARDVVTGRSNLDGLGNKLNNSLLIQPSHNAQYNEQYNVNRQYNIQGQYNSPHQAKPSGPSPTPGVVYESESAIETEDQNVNASAGTVDEPQTESSNEAVLQAGHAESGITIRGNVCGGPAAAAMSTAAAGADTTGTETTELVDAPQPRNNSGMPIDYATVLVDSPQTRSKSGVVPVQTAQASRPNNINAAPQPSGSGRASGASQAATSNAVNASANTSAVVDEPQSTETTESTETTSSSPEPTTIEDNHDPTANPAGSALDGHHNSPTSPQGAHGNSYYSSCGSHSHSAPIVSSDSDHAYSGAEQGCVRALQKSVLPQKPSGLKAGPSKRLKRHPTATDSVSGANGKSVRPPVFPNVARPEDIARSVSDSQRETSNSQNFQKETATNLATENLNHPAFLRASGMLTSEPESCAQSGIDEKWNIPDEGDNFARTLNKLSALIDEKKSQTGAQIQQEAQGRKSSKGTNANSSKRTNANSSKGTNANHNAAANANISAASSVSRAPSSASSHVILGDTAPVTLASTMSIVPEQQTANTANTTTPVKLQQPLNSSATTTSTTTTNAVTAVPGPGLRLSGGRGQRGTHLGSQRNQGTVGSSLKAKAYNLINYDDDDLKEFMSPEVDDDHDKIWKPRKGGKANPNATINNGDGSGSGSGPKSAVGTKAVPDNVSNHNIYVPAAATAPSVATPTKFKFESQGKKFVDQVLKIVPSLKRAKGLVLPSEAEVAAAAAKISPNVSPKPKKKLLKPKRSAKKPVPSPVKVEKPKVEIQTKSAEREKTAATGRTNIKKELFPQSPGLKKSLLRQPSSPTRNSRKHLDIAAAAADSAVDLLDRLAAGEAVTLPGNNKVENLKTVEVQVGVIGESDHAHDILDKLADGVKTTTEGSTMLDSGTESGMEVQARGKSRGAENSSGAEKLQKVKAILAGNMTTTTGTSGEEHEQAQLDSWVRAMEKNASGDNTKQTTKAKPAVGAAKGSNKGSLRGTPKASPKKKTSSNTNTSNRKSSGKSSEKASPSAADAFWGVFQADGPRVGSPSYAQKRSSEVAEAEKKRIKKAVEKVGKEAEKAKVDQPKTMKPDTVDVSAENSVSRDIAQKMQSNLVNLSAGDNSGRSTERSQADEIEGPNLDPEEFHFNNLHNMKQFVVEQRSKKSGPNNATSITAASGITAIKSPKNPKNSSAQNSPTSPTSQRNAQPKVYGRGNTNRSTPTGFRRLSPKGFKRLPRSSEETAGNSPVSPDMKCFAANEDAFPLDDNINTSQSPYFNLHDDSMSVREAPAPMAMSLHESGGGSCMQESMMQESVQDSGVYGDNSCSRTVGNANTVIDNFNTVSNKSRVPRLNIKRTIEDCSLMATETNHYPLTAASNPENGVAMSHEGNINVGINKNIKDLNPEDNPEDSPRYGYHKDEVTSPYEGQNHLKFPNYTSGSPTGSPLSRSPSRYGQPFNSGTPAMPLDVVDVGNNYGENINAKNYNLNETTMDVSDVEKDAAAKNATLPVLEKSEKLTNENTTVDDFQLELRKSVEHFKKEVERAQSPVQSPSQSPKASEVDSKKSVNSKLTVMTSDSVADRNIFGSVNGTTTPPPAPIKPDGQTRSGMRQFVKVEATPGASSNLSLSGSPAKQPAQVATKLKSPTLKKNMTTATGPVTGTTNARGSSSAPKTGTSSNKETGGLPGFMQYLIENLSPSTSPQTTKHLKALKPTKTPKTKTPTAAKTPVGKTPSGKTVTPTSRKPLTNPKTPKTPVAVVSEASRQRGSSANSVGSQKKKSSLKPKSAAKDGRSSAKKYGSGDSLRLAAEVQKDPGEVSAEIDIPSTLKKEILIPATELEIPAEFILDSMYLNVDNVNVNTVNNVNNGEPNTNATAAAISNHVNHHAGSRNSSKHRSDASDAESKNSSEVPTVHSRLNQRSHDSHPTVHGRPAHGGTDLETAFDTFMDTVMSSGEEAGLAKNPEFLSVLAKTQDALRQMQMGTENNKDGAEGGVGEKLSEKTEENVVTEKALMREHSGTTQSTAVGEQKFEASSSSCAGSSSFSQGDSRMNSQAQVSTAKDKSKAKTKKDNSKSQEFALSPTLASPTEGVINNFLDWLTPNAKAAAKRGKSPKAKKNAAINAKRSPNRSSSPNGKIKRNTEGSHAESYTQSLFSHNTSLTASQHQTQNRVPQPSSRFGSALSVGGLKTSATSNSKDSMAPVKPSDRRYLSVVSDIYAVNELNNVIIDDNSSAAGDENGDMNIRNNANTVTNTMGMNIPTDTPGITPLVSGDSVDETVTPTDSRTGNGFGSNQKSGGKPKNRHKKKRGGKNSATKNANNAANTDNINSGKNNGRNDNGGNNAGRNKNNVNGNWGNANGWSGNWGSGDWGGGWNGDWSGQKRGDGFSGWN